LVFLLIGDVHCRLPLFLFWRFSLHLQYGKISQGSKPTRKSFVKSLGKSSKKKDFWESLKFQINAKRLLYQFDKIQTQGL
jgi:hypothetical protein